MTRWILRSALLGVAVAASVSAGPGAKGPNPESRGKSNEARDRIAPKGEEGQHLRIFSGDAERIIRDWFRTPTNVKGLPPGLAKRDELPPGLRKQLQRNGSLPPGLEKKLHPLPSDLEVLLPPLPLGIRRVILGEHVLLLDDRTSAILDILDGAARLAGSF